MPGRTLSLTDRVAVVTGGGHGIGSAYCKALAEVGARVVVAEIDPRAGESVARDIEASGKDALAVATDVADPVSCGVMVEKVLHRWGRIDILVNNAAVFATIPISRTPIEGIPLDEWDLVMRVNLRGLFIMTRAIVPIMKRQGWGRVINISSGTVFEGVATRIHYVTSKAGVIGFTRTLAREVGACGITANAVAPGSTLSESDPSPETIAMRQAHAERRAIQRVQLPSDIVGVVLFLASDDASFITGQTIVVDGGAAMH